MLHFGQLGVIGQHLFVSIGFHCFFVVLLMLVFTLCGRGITVTLLCEASFCVVCSAVIRALFGFVYVGLI